MECPRLPLWGRLPAHVASDVRASRVDLLLCNAGHVGLVLQSREEVRQGLLLGWVPDRNGVQIDGHQPIEEDDGVRPPQIDAYR